MGKCLKAGAVFLHYVLAERGKTSAVASLQLLQLLWARGEMFTELLELGHLEMESEECQGWF